MHDAGSPLPSGAVTIRLGQLDDAEFLATIAADGSPTVVARFADRLSITHGDDYFCLVADAPAPVAYLLAGGTRDTDRKGYGEIYELAVAAPVRRHGVGTALVIAALERFAAAGYAGTVAWVAPDERAGGAFAMSCGFVEDSPEVAPDGALRLSRVAPRHGTRR